MKRSLVTLFMVIVVACAVDVEANGHRGRWLGGHRPEGTPGMGRGPRHGKPIPGALQGPGRRGGWTGLSEQERVMRAKAMMREELVSNGRVTPQLKAALQLINDLEGEHGARLDLLIAAIENPKKQNFETLVALIESQTTK